MKKQTNPIDIINLSHPDELNKKDKKERKITLKKIFYVPKSVSSK